MHPGESMRRRHAAADACGRLVVRRHGNVVGIAWRDSGGAWSARIAASGAVIPAGSSAESAERRAITAVKAGVR